MTLAFKQELAGFLAQFVTERRLALFDRVLAARTRHAVVVLDDVPDPNDAGAVMRSCECFGIQDLHVIARSTPFKVSRGVVVGASKWISLRVHGKGDGDPRPGSDCLAELKRDGYRLVALSRRPGSVPLTSLDLREKLALCLAHEQRGLSEEADRAADIRAYIPAAGFTRGFNLSVCAALTLAFVSRELRARQIPWGLSPEELLDLRLEWLAKMPRRARDLVAVFLEKRGFDKSALWQQNLTEELLRLIG